MTRFSERIGVVRPKAIQSDEIDRELRASLWNVSRTRFFSGTHPMTDTRSAGVPGRIYSEFHKIPIDDIPKAQVQFVAETRRYFLEAPWYKVYEFVEYLYGLLKEGGGFHVVNANTYANELNVILEREKSAFRFIGDVLAPVVDPIGISAIEKGMEHAGRFGSVGEHLRTALALYALKPTPDYRNSVKESISAVEAAACILAGMPSATLGEALKAISSSKPIHEAMRKSMSQLYGYTSNEGGVRHSMIEDTSNVDEADALYMLVTCSAFTNFLIHRS